MMDFFEQQEVARKNTGYLVALFVLAVLALIGVTYVVIASVVAFVERGREFTFEALWDWRILVGVGGSILVLVGGAMLVRMVQLRSGGQVVAEMLGGRRVEPATTEPAERRLLNVVEEMAIASGTPVPPVYILDDESAINAFAAGHTQEDAVIGVTHGALEELTRDELQGVIAHEFSHILNGDMRLNIRLMGVLYGILVIGLVGWFLLRTPIFAVFDSRNRERTAAAVVARLSGLVLVLLGWLGTFFGNLIKAAVSRQREYLADASAVQFTRNPEGIGGALQRIAGYGGGSRLQAAHAVEMSHMLFGEGIRSLFSTHPPVEERIRRVAPQLLSAGARPIAAASAARTTGAVNPAGAAGFAAAAAPAGSPPAMQASLVGPAPEHLQYAQQLIAAIPVSIREAAREPYSARALIEAMLLSEDFDVRRGQLEQLGARQPADLLQETLALRAELQRLGRSYWLPLVDMALPSLSEMSLAQFHEFRTTMQLLIQADARVDLFEWVLLQVVQRHLERHFGLARPGRVRYQSLERLGQACSAVLSLLADAGHREPAAAEHAFETAKFRLGLKTLRRIPRREAMATIEASLRRLAALTPRLKRQLLAACADSISADGEVTAVEAELFRAFASALDCPVPPLLPGQPLMQNHRVARGGPSRTG